MNIGKVTFRRVDLPMKGGYVLKGFADVENAGMVMKGFKVLAKEGKEDSVCMPQHCDKKSGKWYDDIYPTSKDNRTELTKAILAASNGK